jgi:RNA polymerase sigma factor (sigma-70 family)
MNAICEGLSAGEREAIRLTLLPILDDLHRVGFELCRSDADAEELVAETVLRACENFGSLRDRSKAKQWAMRILTNVFLSRYRSRRTKREVPYDEHPEDEGAFSLFDELSSPFFWWGNPEREVVNKFLDEDIAAALGRLPEESRSIVVMCDLEGYSYEEIADIFGVPVGTVRSRLSRARSQLQRQLYHHAVDRGWVSNVTNRREKETNG